MTQGSSNLHKVTNKKTEELRSVVIRFAGDSGEGIQLTGIQFSNEAAIAGNDISTFPNFPSEIRPPAGTIDGVSGFQINFASYEVGTPGDTPDVIVALNPAALKNSIGDLKPSGIVILNEDAFTDTNLKKAGYTDNPCQNEKFLNSYRVFTIPISTLTKKALTKTSLTPKEVLRCKNFFVLGVTLCMFSRPPKETEDWIRKKFASKPELVNANIKALQAGIAYASATEVLDHSYIVKRANLQPGTYRSLSGTTAIVYGLVAASKKSDCNLFYGAYPITPASDILHELSRLSYLGVTTFQAEDEIAAICAALGASFCGGLGVTGSSGPGIALKHEALGLAVMTELPLVVINVQRAGPSTGMPTKTQQADLTQALFGRHGEAPLCVLAASSPRTAFIMTYEACRIALKYMTPVILLSEGFTNYAMEPWRIPDPEELPIIEHRKLSDSELATLRGEFQPYLRDLNTLSRPWAVPGMKKAIHRLGGLEKMNGTGEVSYSPKNHTLMCQYRANKIEGIAREIPPLEIDGEDSGEILVIGWGSTEGACKEAVRLAKEDGISVSRVHLHYICPLPSDLGSIIKRFNKVLVPETNAGQLRMILRDKFLVDAQGLNVLTGEPMKVADVRDSIQRLS